MESSITAATLYDLVQSTDRPAMDLFSDPASVLIREHGEDAALEVAMRAAVILDHTTSGSLTDIAPLANVRNRSNGDSRRTGPFGSLLGVKQT